MVSSYQGVPTYFGQTAVSQPGFGGYQRCFSPVEYHLSYINNLPTDVVIAWRSGFQFILPRATNLLSKTLIIRVEITIQSAIRSDVERFLNEVNEQSSVELRAIREAFELRIKESRFGSTTLIIDYSLSLEKIKEYGGTIYYKEIDQLISLLPIDQVPPHPYSEGALNTHVVDQNYDAVSGFHYEIELIDNVGKQGARYLNINKKVFRIDTKQDMARRDGIYVSSNRAVVNEVSIAGLETLYYSFEDGEEAMGLYRTYEAALYDGDKQTARKEELVALEHELVLHKGYLQRERQQFESEINERDREAKLFAMDRDKHAQQLAEMKESLETKVALERQRIKDYYEDRSHSRKDATEAVKFIPGIVVGLGAVFMAIKAFFPKG